MSREVKHNESAATIQPVIRKRESHNVSRKEMNPNALTVMSRLQRGGFDAYLVGGGVRDLLLGHSPKDFDVATSAHPRQIRQLFRNAYLIGRRFRLVHVKFGADVIETSTFRRDPGIEASAEDSMYQHSDNTFGTPVEDALRRDFTINALFYDPGNFSIIDYVGGLEDIDRRLIRCIGDPDVRFREDPVRMVRAIRFAARLGFTIEDETMRALCRHYREISLASPPRMFEEVLKLFAYGAGRRAFELLEQTRFLSVLFPELADSIAVEPYRSLFWSCMTQVDERTTSTGVSPAPGLIFTILTLPVFRQALDLDAHGSAGADYLATAREVVELVALRYRIPKRISIHMVQVFEAQGRIERSGRKFSRARFASQGYFQDAWLLHRIQLVAVGKPDPGEDGWEGGSEDGATTDDGALELVSAEDSETLRRPRRRRRRGGGGAARRGTGSRTSEPVSS